MPIIRFIQTKQIMVRNKGGHETTLYIRELIMREPTSWGTIKLIEDIFSSTISHLSANWTPYRTGQRCLCREVKRYSATSRSNKIIFRGLRMKTRANKHIKRSWSQPSELEKFIHSTIGGYSLWFNRSSILETHLLPAESPKSRSRLFHRKIS